MNGEDWVMEDRSIANAAEWRKTAALQMQRSGLQMQRSGDRSIANAAEWIFQLFVQSYLNGGNSGYIKTPMISLCSHSNPVIYKYKLLVLNTSQALPTGRQALPWRFPNSLFRIRSSG